MLTSDSVLILSNFVGGILPDHPVGRLPRGRPTLMDSLNPDASQLPVKCLLNAC